MLSISRSMPRFLSSGGGFFSEADFIVDGDEVSGTNPDNAATDPLDADTDDDGLSDGDEVSGNNPGSFTSNPTLIDTDSDTFSDAEEVASLYSGMDLSRYY